MALGTNVRKYREQAGLTQTELAERAGMDQQALAALEKRDSKSSSFTAALAKALGVTIGDLLGHEEPGLKIVSAQTDAALSPEEIVQLVELYSQSTKDGRKQILRMARVVDKLPHADRAISPASND